MSDSNQALKIVCSAMLQSWRNTALGPKERFTEIHPTKSGITGMVACAMGYPRNDKRIDKLKNSFELYLSTRESGTIPDVLMDYHTVHSKSGMLRIDGKYDKNASITNREFIVNHRFVLYIKATDKVLREIQDALENPVWDYYLGSKCCIPAEPVCGGIVDSVRLEDENVYQHIRV